MKRMLCLLCVMVLSLTFVCPVFAAADTFVPSISYKDGPDIDVAKLGDENVTGCLIVTSIKGAKDKTTDITQDDRDLLLDVYGKLKNGTMKLPLTGDYVIRELVDVSFENNGCRVPGHGHKEELAKEGTTISITFDLGVYKTTDVAVLSYVDGQWIPAKSVKNNGNGTVTVVFEDICPVAFCIDADAEDVPVKTGDAFGQNLGLWIALMVVSLGGILVLMFLRRRIVR